ncbi:polyphosphate polymerase domain-containing protein [Acidaminobacter sp. JC074]|uniref:polyphosphate polymerase domain-containing protein n=1 Tax=Acidaminobacter sp. JC074 TaxID=2530199 RepID=UPI001F0E0383|nr:polyphosphate polymerase domain-containing protein [Acidaminobacter sp. JC074]MCH4888138.1 polyphosphate polymerase domain-containing protein [Acidaminobacter sp. JC074]
MYRHEIKYVIDYHDFIIYKHRLDGVLKRDPYSQDKAYTITSLYYDDHYDTALKEKVEGYASRYKYRLRYYNSDYSRIKLEKKSKTEQMTHKKSVWVEENYELNREFEFLIKYGVIKPVSLVRYERLAYVHPLGNLRITFDMNVRGVKHGPDLFDSEDKYSPLLKDNHVIMEVKFNGVLPDFICRLLESNRHMQTSSSKYVFSRLAIV